MSHVRSQPLQLLAYYINKKFRKELIRLLSLHCLIIPYQLPYLTTENHIPSFSRLHQLPLLLWLNNGFMGIFVTKRTKTTIQKFFIRRTQTETAFRKFLPVIGIKKRPWPNFWSRCAFQTTFLENQHWMDIQLCYHWSLESDDGVSTHLWNVGQHQLDYKARHPRRLWTSHSPPWEPEISHMWPIVAQVWLQQPHNYGLVTMVTKRNPW
jgi:hypothetical protein